MQDWTMGRRVRAGVGLAWGLGMLAGAGEALAVASTAPLVLGGVGGLLLGAASALLSGGIGAAVGLLTAPLLTLRPEAPVHRTLATQLGVVAVVLVLPWVLPLVLDMASQGRWVVLAMLIGMPVGAAGAVALNGRFLLAKVATGWSPPASWPVASAAGAGALVLAAALVGASRDPSPSFGLDADRNVLLITTEGLRHDELAALGDLPRRGVTFTRAVTPSTSTVAAHASLLTGLHPLRHQALDDLRELPLGWSTLVERLRDEGWATAAYVSTVALDGVGLDQGFGVFDAAAGPLVGLERLGWFRLAGPPAVRRDAERTARRAVAWLDGHARGPFFLWVHLEVPPTAEPEARAASAASLRGAVEALLERLDADAALASRTLVLLAGAHGVASKGDPLEGLGDPLVRVPLVLVPGREPVPTSTIDVQVRTLDVAATPLAWLGLDRTDTMEGVELMGFLDGRRDQGLGLTLLGRVAGDERLLGLRDDGAKVVLDLGADDLALYDLEDDPDEGRDVSGERPEAAERARSLLGPELRALERLEAETRPLPGREALLRRLGRR